MTDDIPQLPRVTTGIPGLDPILEGGLLQGGVYIVQGPPGAGKTILGNQICYHHARGGERAVYATLLAESHTRMIAHLRRLSFFDGALVPEGVYYISAFKTQETEGLDGLLTILRQTLAQRRATLLVLDGLVSAREVAPSPQAFKKFVRELQSIVSLVGTTALLLTNPPEPGERHPEHTMVDGVIELSHEPARLHTQRHVQVHKLRGARQVPGRHTLEISDEGLRVRARFETQPRFLRPAHESTAPGERRLGFGLPSLDAMLHGGVPSHSITMLLGATGTGKTLLGLKFLAEGARRGELGLHFGFFEKPEAILRKSDRLGLGLREAVAQGTVALVWNPIVEGVIDSLGEQLLAAVHERRVTRLFLDGLQGFEQAAEFPERIRDVFAAITDELEARGVTTLYSLETRDLFGPQLTVPVSNISTVTHNVILLRHVEFNAELRRLVSILKVRDSDYDEAIREFRITGSGIRVADTFKTAERILTGTARGQGLMTTARPRSRTRPEGASPKKPAGPKKPASKRRRPRP